MHKYEEFLKDCIGKKKNNWTFVAFNRVAKGNSSVVIVDCKCDCGFIVKYSASQCISHLFPLQCMTCTLRAKKKRQNEERRIQAEILKEHMTDDKKEEIQVVSSFGNHYKKYYRD